MAKVILEQTDPREDPFFGGMGVLIPYRPGQTISSSPPSTERWGQEENPDHPGPHPPQWENLGPESPYRQEFHPNPPFPAPEGKAWAVYDGLWILLTEPR